MRTKITLILALLMGLATTVLFYRYTAQFDEEELASRMMVDVVTATETIRKNQRISSAHIQISSVPEEGLHPGALRTTAEVVGKYATADIAPGEPILGHRVGIEAEETLFVSRKFDDPFRAVSIGVNFVQSVSNMIEPEDRVDVVLSKVNPETKEPESELLLEDVRVLAVGRRMVESTPGQPYVEYSSATLALTQQDSLILIQGTQEGSIQLILRSRINAISVTEGGG